MTEDADAASKDRLRASGITLDQKSQSRQWFTTPQPIKRLFDRFPLVAYPSNELPLRTPGQPDKNALYIFTTEEGAKSGAASFNPGCLKWQAYLKFRRIPFVTIPSNNHASPSGALPFLLPSAASSSFSNTFAAVPSSRILRWSRDVVGHKANDVKGPEHTGDRGQAICGGKEAKGSHNGSLDMRYEAYMALLDHRIRNAYLYSLYLSPSNFASIAQPLYINTPTNNPLVRLTLSYQLRTAAESELLKQSTLIDVEAIYRESDKAFKALSELLGDYDYFFNGAEPGLFDASVFAYTNILLDEGLDWKDRQMRGGLRQCQNLVAHRRRIAEAYF